MGVLQRVNFSSLGTLSNLIKRRTATGNTANESGCAGIISKSETRKTPSFLLHCPAVMHPAPPAKTARGINLHKKAEVGGCISVSDGNTEHDNAD